MVYIIILLTFCRINFLFNKKYLLQGGTIMREDFVNEFISKLYNKVSDDILKSVSNELFLHVQNYDIQKRETSVGEYTGYLPECFKIYFVSRKIEGLSLKTLELYKMYLEDFFIKTNKEFEKITANDIRIYLYNTQKERNISNRTLDGRRAALHAFFEWSANEGYIGHNPCRNINKIKYERVPREPLSLIELEKIRISCKTIREKALIEFLYSSGCRVSELCIVKKSDINFEKGEVILLGKGNKHRKSYINERCSLYLNFYLESRCDESEYLFVSERKPHNCLKKEAVERIVRNLGKRSNIGRPLHPHLFRNTLTTTLLTKSVPITNVQKILGHVNINTTMIYAKIDDEDVKNNHRKFS